MLSNSCFHWNHYLIVLASTFVVMAHLFCSESYRWANNDVIGKGSEATVYKGRNKVRMSMDRLLT